MKCERLLCKVVDALWSYDAPPPAPPPPTPVELPWWGYILILSAGLALAMVMSPDSFGAFRRHPRNKDKEKPHE